MVCAAIPEFQRLRQEDLGNFEVSGVYEARPCFKKVEAGAGQIATSSNNGKELQWSKQGIQLFPAADKGVPRV